MCKHDRTKTKNVRKIYKHDRQKVRNIYKHDSNNTKKRENNITIESKDKQHVIKLYTTKS